jgi:copper chaperone CopZ
MKTGVLNVSGMHCSSCSMLVTMEVTDLTGVQSVTCDYATGHTVVEFDDSVTSIDEIVRTVAKAGYTATPAS